VRDSCAHWGISLEAVDTASRSFCQKSRTGKEVVLIEYFAEHQDADMFVHSRCCDHGEYVGLDSGYAA
jgi:hypothetical protein